jgi:pimeloyl-ACP methyl ester carboxylesterase
MWVRVITKLQSGGLEAIALANPLRGLSSDAAHIARAAAGIDGPVMLVGHCYGGAVITAAGYSADKVIGLVYLAASRWMKAKASSPSLAAALAASEARQHPEVLAGKSVGQVADHFAAISSSLERKPAIIGHSFGGLIAQILAGRGLAAATVAIDPAPFRGVLPLPLSALRVASPALGNPANRHRAVPLTFEQFRYAFYNAVAEEEAKQLFEVPAPGLPLFQAAAANLNPWTEVKVDTETPTAARC